MNRARPNEPLAQYGDYPSLYLLGAKVPSSRFARKTWKRVAAWAAFVVALLMLTSGGWYATKRLWSPEQAVASAVNPPAAKAKQERVAK